MRPSILLLFLFALTSLPTFEVPGVAFDFDLHQLKSSYFTALDSFVVVMQQNSWREILILGHTDDVGEADYNLQLSTKRALAVKQYLEEQLKTNSVIIQAQGKGECCPKVANNSEENRALNRRVEIIPKF